MAKEPENCKTLEAGIWDAACSIRGSQDATKYKEFILPIIFAKRLYDGFDDEINRQAEEISSREKTFKLVGNYKKLMRFYISFRPKNLEEPVWTVICNLSDRIGEQLTTLLHEIAKENPNFRELLIVWISMLQRT